MREKNLENALVRAARRRGALALKFVSPGCDGVPDRLLLFPGGRAAFCEVKAPGRKPRPLQKYRMAQLQRLGFPVFVLDDPVQIAGILCTLDPDLPEE